jgi:hypothetical protein
MTVMTKKKWKYASISPWRRSTPAAEAVGRPSVG